MKFKRRKRSETANWALVAGVVLTGAAAIYGISRLLRTGPVSRRRDMRGLEKSVVQALLHDDVAGNQAIDIAAIGAGIVELSGTVGSGEDARHIVDVVEALPGVHAIVNRLEIQVDESRLSRNRKRNSGEAVRWYGGHVGIGRRRQSMSTDPLRRDDHASLKSRALQPNRDDVLTDVEEMEDSGVRIGVTNSTALGTRVPPHSPNERLDEPPPPPPVVTND